MIIQKIKFGSSPNEIDTLAKQVIKGEKTATPSLLDYYLNGLKKQSQIGEHFSILDSSEKEVAIVQIEKIEIIKFSDIDENFAVQEGDGNLNNWKAIHIPYYSHLLSNIGKELNDDTLLLCEWFKLIKVL